MYTITDIIIADLSSFLNLVEKKMLFFFNTMLTMYFFSIENKVKYRRFNQKSAS
jgi:hypothetical protein